MLEIQRLPAYVALPACALGGAALKYLLIQVNQLAVNRLGWSSIHCYDGKTYEQFRASQRDELHVFGNRHKIPSASQPSVFLWTTVLLAATEQIVYRLLLERKVLPRLLPPSISRYAWLFPAAIAAGEACSSHPSFTPSTRATAAHRSCAHAIYALAQHHLGLPGAICTGIGYRLYHMHVSTGWLSRRVTFTAMNPLYLIHWKTVTAFFSLCYAVLVPKHIQLLMHGRR